MKKQAVAVGLAILAIVLVGLSLWKQRQRAGGDGETHATPYDEMSRFSTIKADREVMVHCGNSMRLAMEWIAAEFQRRHNIAVVFNFGGGSELLPLIELGGRGDLFLCHDPYEARLKEKGLIADSVVVGSLRPVILVPKGNPKGIGKLEDLAQAGLRIASVDARYATAGKMLHAVLDRESWGMAVRQNIVIESRGHSDAAQSVLTGHTDAAVVWNFLVALYPDKLGKVECDVVFPQTVRVTLCKLNSSQNAEEANKLMEFVQSDYAIKVWNHYGYRNANEQL
jgi:molybdate transport system substrate-binding protein